MKRAVILILALATISAATAFAQRRPPDHFGERDEASEWSTRELRELTGRLQIDDWGRLSLIVDERTYALMYRPQPAQELAIEDGQTATVTGYEMPPPRFAPDDELRRFAPVTMRIDDRTIDVTRGRARRLGDRGRAGRHYERYLRPYPDNERHRPGDRRR